jgi:hypothetical protein
MPAQLAALVCRLHGCARAAAAGVNRICPPGFRVPGNRIQYSDSKEAGTQRKS